MNPPRSRARAISGLYRLGLCYGVCVQMYFVSFSSSGHPAPHMGSCGQFLHFSGAYSLCLMLLQVG